MKFKESKLAHQYCTGYGLEIGGSAHNPFKLNTKNIDFTKKLTTFKKEEINLCGEYCPVDIEAAGDDIPLPDESQDFIISSHVLEHFTDPIKALLEWYRLVKKGGIIFMIIPHKERTFDRTRNRTTLQELIDRHAGKVQLDESTHEHYSVWVTEDLVELIAYMNKNSIFPNPMKFEAVQDVDDKVGNGFTIVLRKIYSEMQQYDNHPLMEEYRNARLSIGVLSLDPIQTACYYIRLAAPLADLERKKLIRLVSVMENRNGRFEINLDAARKVDILIVQRQFPSVLTYEKLIRNLGNYRPKIIYELDDALTLIPTRHIDYKYYCSKCLLIENYIREADLVTVSTEKLKSYYESLNCNITVLPNSIDMQIWDLPLKERPAKKPVNILFSGSMTHSEDLKMIEDVILRIVLEFGDEVQFLFWGNTSLKLQHFAQIRQIHGFFGDYKKYADCLKKKSEIDFAIIPLEDSLFNQAKSAIKWLEYSACGIPGIYSDIEPYSKPVENRKTGILVKNTKSDWYDAIKTLIADHPLRRRLALNAYIEVLNKHTVSSNSLKWLVAYQKAFTPVSIIIPVANTHEYVHRCIASICKYPPAGKYEIIIIDCSSKDCVINSLVSIRNSFSMTIKSDNNSGIAGVYMQGIRVAKYGHLVLLDSFNEVTENWLRPLQEILEKDPNVAAVGSKVITPAGRIKHAGVIIAEDRDRNDCWIAKDDFVEEPSDSPEANILLEYQALCGDCLLIRKQALEDVGGFENGCGHCRPEIDLCLKLIEKKWKLVYQPMSVVIFNGSNETDESALSPLQDPPNSIHRRFATIRPDITIHTGSSIRPKNRKDLGVYNMPLTPNRRLDERLFERNGKLISIVILTFNQIKCTQECLESIRRHTPDIHEIIFVDNGSTDGTVKWLRSIVKGSSNYKLIENFENRGFSAGCNQGIKAAESDFILLLNNDVIVSKGWLASLMECLQRDSGVGIVGPMTNNISGLQKVPQVGYQRLEKLDEYVLQFKKRNRNRRIKSPRVVGFCMLFRRSLVDEIGYLDESFGSGNFEDDDFCLRATLAGYQNMIAGDVFIHHYGSRTFIGNRIDYSASISGNRKVFDAKWGSKEIAQQYGNKLIIQNAVNRAEESYRKGDIKQATALMLTAIKEAPHDSQWYLKLSEMLIDAKRQRQAQELLESIPQIGNVANVNALMGYCLEALGNHEKAVEHVERALAIEPSMPLALNVRGVLAYKRGELEAAERFFNSAIEADPSFGESYTNLGSMKWAAGEHDQALDLFERGFILAPTVGDVATAYHTAVVETRSFSRAETVLAEACALHPNDRRIAFTKIALLLQQEKNDEAMDAIEPAMMKFGIDDGILAAGLKVRDAIGPHKGAEGNGNRISLSVCMIVKNEERHLAGCLFSVKAIASEIIVVDTGSTDRTKEIAKAFGAKVFEFAWTNDFSEARNYSLSKATGDWILVLDADERLAAKDHDRLIKLMRKEAKRRFAYALTTRNYCRQPSLRGWTANDGEYYGVESGDGWIPSTKVRLFPNHKGISFVGAVHELVEPTLRGAGIQMRDCNVPVHHYGKMDSAKNLAKGADYYRLGLKKIEETNGGYQALKELAVQASELEEYGEAVKIWQKALELNPKDAVACMNAGYAYFQVENFQVAHELSKKALELDPHLREAALNLSGCELMLDNAGRAITLLEGILAKEPDYPPAMGRIAAAYILGGRQKEGLEYLRRLHQRNYNCYALIEEQARALSSLGKVREASLLMEAVAKISDSALESHPVAIGSAEAPDFRPVPKGDPGAFSTVPRGQDAQLNSSSC